MPLLKNAKSNKMGKKDIIKVECPIEALDLDILGFIDHNITVNVIKGDRIVEKKELKLRSRSKNVIKCKNPRCVTSIEQELDQIFILADEEKRSVPLQVLRGEIYQSEPASDKSNVRKGAHHERMCFFWERIYSKISPAVTHTGK